MIEAGFGIAFFAGDFLVHAGSRLDEDLMLLELVEEFILADMIWGVSNCGSIVADH